MGQRVDNRHRHTLSSHPPLSHRHSLHTHLEHEPTTCSVETHDCLSYCCCRTATKRSMLMTTQELEAATDAISDTSSSVVFNETVIQSQTTDAVGVLALLHFSAWRQGAALLLLVAALLFVCSRKVVSINATRLTLLLRELGRKRSRSALAGIQVTPYADGEGGEDDEQRVSQPSSPHCRLCRTSHSLLHTAHWSPSPLCAAGWHTTPRQEA